MRNLAISGLVLVCVMGGVFSCSTRHTSQEEINSFIDEFEKKVEYLDRRVAEAQWDIYASDQYKKELYDTLEYYSEAHDLITRETPPLSTIKQYLSLAKGDEAKRKLELIYRRCRRMVIEQNENIKALSGSILSGFEMNSSTLDELRNDMRRESNRDRRRDLYAEIMEYGNRIAEDIALVARNRNQAVSRMGYNSYYDFMLLADGVNKQDLANLLEQLDRHSSEKYRQALDSLKNVLRLDDIRIWDIDYAFEDIDRRMLPFYGAENQRGLLESTLDGLGFRLRALPIYFMTIDGQHIPHLGDVFAMHIPDDVRIPVSLANGMNSLETLFGQAGRSLYATHIDPDGYLLTQAPAPCFEEGMARVIGGLVELSAWKRKYAGLPETLVIESKVRREFLRLFNLRLTLANIYFEQKMYADPFADLQQVYAAIFEEFMQFPLGGDFRPWAADISYVLNPVRFQNHLIAECIAAQTYHYLTEKYDSVLDNQRTREFLVQNYYRFGARDDWQTLLERGTGEKLNGKYYFDFPCD